MILTMLASDRSTVTPLSRAQLLHQVQTRHPSPSARQFRLPVNGLAQSELRRIFRSDEGALMRIFLHISAVLGAKRTFS
jgi:hypothetical protein